LAAGKGILAADLPSFRKYLSENNAIFYDRENAGDLAEKIMEMIDDPEHLESLSEQALKDSLAHTWLARAEKIIHALNV